MADDNKQLNLPEREEKILAMWEREKVFEKSLSKNLPKSSKLKAKSFVFYEGPPSANGLPHIGHFEARVFKDLIPRYKTMRGFFVARKAGWDTHGLPIELQAEKELGFKKKQDIEHYGIGKFNEKCRELVWRYKEEWSRFTSRIGFWLDMEHPYITYDPKYMETLWWIIKEIWKKGLLYKDFKVVPWCPRCETGLSSHELGQPGAYQKVTDKSVYVKLKITNHKSQITNHAVPEYLLIWTTTPWTLPANVAVAVNPDINYVKIKHTSVVREERITREQGIMTEHLIISPGTYLLAQDIFLKSIYSADVFGVRSLLDISPDDLLADVRSAPKPNDFFQKHQDKIEIIKGADLIGVEYEALYPQNDIPYRVIAGDFVTTEDGTGIVHIAPAFGDDDMRAVKQHYGAAYPILQTVNSNGTMRKGIVGEGKFVKDADKDIIDDLQKRGLLYRVKPYEHDYPHCWRCNTPLLYFAKDAWWIRMSELRGELLKQNETINWVPGHLQNGRFGEFLKEVRDWAFSRERYWGTPLPVWECKKCEHREVVGSLDEFDSLAKKSGNEYFLMRHGESETQLLWITDDDDAGTYHLTDRGKKQVAATAKKLKKEGIDMIVSSDVLRTRETAKIVADTLGIKDVITDPRIREIHVGVFEHKSPDEYHGYYSSLLEKFTKRPPEGESLNDLKKRVMAAMLEYEKKYQNKKILIISHEYSIWVLWGAGQGMDNEAMAAEKEKRGADFVGLASVTPLPFRTLPCDERGEVNLHRPFVDDVILECPKCGNEMKRVSEVVDVWFDSGSMPWASQNYADINAEKRRKGLRPSAFSQRESAISYPADYISEAIDQTRGWFYTLLAVGTLLGKGTPYKNVISLGHVLDRNAQKMSKSKGNVVDPWAMIEKYGADVIRWYFYTINHPGDPKLFDEKDLLLRSRGFFGTLWNSYQLFNTYVDKVSIQHSAFSIQHSRNVLDVWIFTRLDELVAGVTKNLDEYEIMNAARLIEEFVINDFSQWYLRRSRRRFQKPESKKEKDEAAETTAHVLLTLAKLIAPFAPFFAEILWQELVKKCGLKSESVHLEAWPVANYNLQSTTYKLLDDMKTVREVVAEALKLRAEAGIKVRQPLAKIQIPKSKFQINSKIQMPNDFLDLLRDELNVKEVVWGDELKLDTTITPELREEGMVREFIRTVQEMRKDAGLQPGQIIRCQVSGDSALETILEKWAATIKKEANAKELKIGGKKKFRIERETKIDGQKIWVGFDKI